MQWSIGEVATTTGTTSRTLRHYNHVGLLAPTRVGSGGIRYYDEQALVRLQRILVLRELGLGLDQIAAALGSAPHSGDESRSAAAALRRHLADLAAQTQRLQRLTASVQHTIDRLEAGEPLVAEQMFDGFDHTQHRAEVEERWGTEAYAASDQWWRSVSATDKQAFSDELNAIVEGFAVASARGLPAENEAVQVWARRQYEWVSRGWGGTGPSAEAFTTLGQMYVDDPRFGRTYEVDGRPLAGYVRDAMAVFAQRHLT